MEGSMGKAMKVTIGISFFNSEATLEDAVRSVFAQTFKDWELILIDDGSTDRSLSIARSILDRRVSVLRDGRNLGPASRLDQIADLANGEYIARMDADDMMHPMRIEKQVRWLDARPDVDLLDTALYTIDSRNKPLGIRGCDKFEVTPRHCIAQGLLNQPSILGRAEWMRRNRYNAGYKRAEDYELWCRAVAKGDCRFARLPEPLLFYREEGSIRLRKVLDTQTFMRRAMRLHGFQLIGVGQMWRYVAQSYLKSAAWILASACGVPQVLYHRRSRALSNEERGAASAAIRDVLRTDVPGMHPIAEL